VEQLGPVLQVLAERLLWMLGGACVGALAEWRWHVCDRIFDWLERRPWNSFGRG